MAKIHQKRFDELLKQLESIIASQAPEYDSRFEENRQEINCNLLLEWRVKVRNLLSKVCGTESEHYKEFTKNESVKFYETNLSVLEKLKAIFLQLRKTLKVVIFSQRNH